MRRHSVASLENARSLANCPSVGGGGEEGLKRCMYSAFPQSLFFVYERSLRAELNGGGSSLHWKANICSLYLVL